MNRGTKFISIAFVVIVAIILQIVLILADNSESPGKAATEFSKAYFMLNKAMEKRLCSKITEDEESDAVNDYLNRKADQARAEGFEVSWLKMALSHVETKTQMVDDSTAEVHITFSRRRSVNPVYAVVAKIFFLGEIFKGEETLSLVKENNRWKVCGQPFALIEG
ncbi:MAG: hypothetical protein KJO61_04860 [Deltaproteobacteria bacterium]|nr:hypothetical protein [Deltaproteobacteria bacterium]